MRGVSTHFEEDFLSGCHVEEVRKGRWVRVAGEGGGQVEDRSPSVVVKPPLDKNHSRSGVRYPRGERSWKGADPVRKVRNEGEGKLSKLEFPSNRFDLRLPLPPLLSPFLPLPPSLLFSTPSPSPGGSSGPSQSLQPFPPSSFPLLPSLQRANDSRSSSALSTSNRSSNTRSSTSKLSERNQPSSPSSRWVVIQDCSEDGKKSRDVNRGSSLSTEFDSFSRSSVDPLPLLSPLVNHLEPS